MNLSIYYGGARVEPGVPDAAGDNRLLLGPVHHAEVGTPVRYFFDGITAVSGSSTIEFALEGPGTLHADRLEWTPDTPGTYSLVLTDDAGGRRTQQIIVRADSGTASGKTVLVIGDSITMADGSYAWVAGLRSRLTGKGISTSFLGSQSNSPNPVVGVTHEGFSGRNYANFVIANPFLGDFSSWIGTYGTPNVVVFALGTNDITAVTIGSLTQSQMVGYARTLIDACIADMPSAKKAFFLPYPYNANPAAWGGAPTLLQYRTARHNYIEAMLTEFAEELESGDLHAIPMHGCMSGTGNHLDALHPDSTGHARAIDQVYPWVRAAAVGTL